MLNTRPANKHWFWTRFCYIADQNNGNPLRLTSDLKQFTVVAQLILGTPKPFPDILVNQPSLPIDMNPKIQELLSAANLPSPPQTAIKILQLEKDPNAGIAELTKIVESDTAIATRILRYANSPISGMARKVVNLNQATTLFGLQKIKLIALTFSLQKTRSESQNMDIEAFWRRSIGVGVSASQFSNALGLNSDNAFIIGLLSRIGFMLVNCGDYDSYDRIMDQAKSDQEVQRRSIEIYGQSLYSIGATALRNWEFPIQIYGPIEESVSPDLTDNMVAKVQWLSRNVAELLYESDYEVSVEECREYFNVLAENKLDADDETNFESLFELISERYLEYLEMMDISIPELNDLWQLEYAARDQLMKIANQTIMEKDNLVKAKVILEDEMQTDVLTGLGNRRQFERRANEEVERAITNRREVAMLVVDVDKFKGVNDTYGHLIGDEILKLIGQCIGNHIRKYDSAFRFGGEEFVVLVPECSLKNTLTVAERVREIVERSSLNHEDQQIRVTVSIGVAHFDGRSTATWQELFDEADQQLYRAKNGGRNQVQHKELCVNQTLPAPTSTCSPPSTNNIVN